MSNYSKESFEIASHEAGSQKRIDVDSVLKVYYGMNNDGNLRLSFLSSVAPPKMESTKLLRVLQGKETDEVYWTSFDLLQGTAKQVFFSFCSDLTASIDGINEERKALAFLKNRFHIWKTMFKKERDKIPEETVRGLFGELYFIQTILADKYGINGAIDAWSGADKASKDFSKDADWFEIKAVSSSAVSVKITSVSQLSSDISGHLIIIKLEAMSPGFTDGKSSVGELMQAILQRIDLDETRELFFKKLLAYGFDLTDDCCSQKYKVASMKSYIVGDQFPRLLESDIAYPEICKLSYELIINSLDRFKEG